MIYLNSLAFAKEIHLVLPDFIKVFVTSAILTLCPRDFFFSFSKHFVPANITGFCNATNEIPFIRDP